MEEGEVLHGAVRHALLVLVHVVARKVAVELFRHHVHAPVVKRDV
eukprot:CAMPEP_0118955812 /NCGR_PEP_ID=MMETSP1169-20130426/60542_1 /TAXON_ID=36882 /ORGANISM="Pyramimonas obovata, Strain CCMP722" /LENGTH=44 /DNA_ID= /DNA_START= /DNA_END= /DNA_ORIENTATION=